MNTEFFIASRIISGKNNRSVAHKIVKIAIIGIALGMTVMIISVAVVTGFKNQVRSKVIGFGSHIVIENYDNNRSYEAIPISNNQPFLQQIKQQETVRHIQQYATKAGIVKTGGNIQGLVLKGIGDDYDWSFFEQSLIKGERFTIEKGKRSDKIIISKYIANLLELNVNDTIIMYFIQKPPRYRKFIIQGIYDTGLEEYDKIIALVDIGHIRRLNRWEPNQISGFEILLNDFDQLDRAYSEINEIVGYTYCQDCEKLQVRTIKQANPQIFSWLDLSNRNVWIILVLMVIVAGFNMISGLLILILERTNMIGILKALGMKNINIRKIFLYNALFLIGKGLLWGNIIGIALCLIQQHFELLPLDPSSYYMDTVPINLKIWHILLLNAGALLATVSMLLLPSLLITRIRPIKAIRFN